MVGNSHRSQSLRAVDGSGACPLLTTGHSVRIHTQYQYQVDSNHSSFVMTTLASLRTLSATPPAPPCPSVRLSYSMLLCTCSKVQRVPPNNERCCPFIGPREIVEVKALPIFNTNQLPEVLNSFLVRSIIVVNAQYSSTEEVY